ncbi:MULTISPECIES: FKBP-type peptidyl-prolyl cis-trans isomerase [Porticoccus]|jgi:FKBP-type peptidyl-prolyl cis-trans isomerase SlpA|uniref:FKBP-type peptidyl-prolyl cis-trans isomerase n=1 Tax=Porticoccus TaxID=1123967 RepID=UPI000569E880|nr:MULTISPECIES: FKBP-type peptidyl-prolyl cis-trans isomerase [Porticoccus]MAZ69685.1 peptidylprolyl isomerase [Porticoccus sp.]|tara:strand:+ start:48119 stop:48586 length:468 start_codon:yes stop_codon:yes gene_type:complete
MVDTHETAPVTIGPDTKVTLHFSLALEDGSVVDSNFSGKPATFVVGDGSLLNGFESALFGLSTGDEAVLEIDPEQGFGPHNPNNIQRFSKGDFTDDVQLEPGLMLSFADASQAELPGVVVEVDDEHVMVDFNHPLAGHQITFAVKILDVIPAVTH